MDSDPSHGSKPTAPQVPPPEIVIADSKRVSCNGGGGALGHPIVFYEMGDEDFVECKYCDRRFVLRGSAADPTRKS